MTGAKVGNNPWKSLAASVILKARDDCRGCMESGIKDDITRALIQYDAERWLRHDWWCQHLLDCSLPPECDVHQSILAQKTCQRRRRSYRKCLPEDIDFNEQMPIHSLAKTTGLSRIKLCNAAKDGRLSASQQPNGSVISWYTSIAEVACAVSEGLVVTRRK